MPGLPRRQIVHHPPIGRIGPFLKGEGTSGAMATSRVSARRLSATESRGRRSDQIEPPGEVIAGSTESSRGRLKLHYRWGRHLRASPANLLSLSRSRMSSMRDAGQHYARPHVCAPDVRATFRLAACRPCACQSRQPRDHDASPRMLAVMPRRRHGETALLDRTSHSHTLCVRDVSSVWHVAHMWNGGCLSNMRWDDTVQCARLASMQLRTRASRRSLLRRHEGDKLGSAMYGQHGRLRASAASMSGPFAA